MGVGWGAGRGVALGSLLASIKNTSFLPWPVARLEPSAYEPKSAEFDTQSAHILG